MRLNPGDKVTVTIEATVAEAPRLGGPVLLIFGDDKNEILVPQFEIENGTVRIVAAR